MKTLKILLISLFLTSISHAEITRYSISSFEGGLNTKVSANQLPKNQCSEAVNILFDEKPGSIVVRGGYTLVSTTTARELWEYPKANGQLFLIKHYQGTLSYSLDFGVSWTVITTGLKWELGRIRATVYDDKFFVFDGISDVGVFDGTDWNTYSFIPKGKYPVTSKNKLFIANTWDNPDFIYYNTDGSDPVAADSWLADNYEVIGFKDGDIITGVTEYRNQLVVFKRYSKSAILGYFPDSWRVIKLNSEYGCMQQDSISVDKGVLKFMSASGLKGYAGSGVFDVDYLIKDKILNSNNLIGEYNYLQITNSSDFDDGTYILRISTTLNEIKLQAFTATFNSSETFVNGVFSGVQITEDSLTLTETGKASERIEPSLLAIRFVEKGGSVNDYDVAVTYDNVHFIIDNDLLTSATLSEDFGYQTLKDSKIDILSYSSIFAFIFTVPKDTYNQVSLHGIIQDFSGGNARVNIYAKRLSDNKWRWLAVHSVGFSSFIEYLYDDITIPFSGFYTNQIKVEITSMFHLPYITTLEQSLEVYDVGRLDYISRLKPPDGDYIYTTKGRTVNPRTIKHKLSQINEIKVYKQSTAPTYPSTGTYTSTTTAFGDLSQDVEFGTFTASGYTSLSEGTTIAYRTRTSTETSTPISKWSSWSGWVSSPTFKITSPDGKYLQWQSSFTTTMSSYTPTLFSVDITALASTGTWISKQYNIGKVKGGWSYFIADTKLNSQTANFWVRLGTGSTDVTNTAWTSITSGSLISGTTNENWIQYKVGFETADGRQNPIVRSITSVYAPESAPVVAQAISIQDRWHIAISTPGDTNNSTVLVQDKNNAWTVFEIDIDGWTKFGQDTLFSNSKGIFKMYDGTTDSGTIITSKWEKVLNFDDNTFDKQVDYIYTVGQNKGSSGSLDISYKIENSTINFTTNNIDTGSTGIFRHKQPVRGSAVNYITLKLSATSYFEVNGIDVWQTPKREFVK